MSTCSFSATTSLDRKWETAGVWRFVVSSLLSLAFYVKPTYCWRCCRRFGSTRCLHFKGRRPPNVGIVAQSTRYNNPRTESSSVIIPARYSKFEPYRMRRPNCGAFSRKIVSRLFRICVTGWFMQYYSPLLEWVLCHSPVHPCTSVHCLQSCANTIRSAWRKFSLVLF
jgi:hypothetical protein